MSVTAVVLFNRDLRVHDQPALAAAAAAGDVVPLFVLDTALLTGRNRSPNRAAFLVDCLRDLREALAARGATLLVRRGDVVEETMRVVQQTSANAVHVSADVSSYAKRREQRLEVACRSAGLTLSRFPGVTVVPPRNLRTAARDHYRVFTPYWRAWRAQRWRPLAPVPARLRVPAALPSGGSIPDASMLVAGARSPHLVRGGEREGRRLMTAWLRGGIAEYESTRDELAGAGTSRLSAHLHLGCISPLGLAGRALVEPGGEAFLRQLCWRDFHHQVTDAFPDIQCRDYRPRGRRWNERPDALVAWRRGATGVAVVDAAMRQLLEEGWMPNRARLIAAGYLVRTVGLDWRAGEAHFMRWLVDGDVANNAGNWQWVAGTGNDTRPNRGFNVERQSRRFDSDGSYVRRHPPRPPLQQPDEETVMRVVVSGATGTLGEAVVGALRARGDEVVALSRDPARIRAHLGGVEAHAWPDPKQAPPPAAALSGARAVVHLLGEPVAQRWTAGARAEISASRVLSTRHLVAALGALPDADRPAILVSQSATGYYGAHGDEWLTEDDQAGEDFLARLVDEWEFEALAAASIPGMRVVVTRTGVVVSPDGGALAKMLPPFRVGLGGPVGGGRQYVPWVHIDDVAVAVLHCIDTPAASGPVNLVAPSPVTNAQLSHALGRVLHRPAVMPVPAFAVRALYGEMATIVTTGQRVAAQRLLEMGYRFRFPDLDAALRDVLRAAA